MLKAEWIDGKREPRCPPDPAFPDGIDLDVSHGAVASCHTLLDYPAPRCGYFVVTCETCNQRVVVTTAGRPDDPRSIKLGCLSRGTA